MNSRVDIEEVFSAVVKKCDGEIVHDTVGPSPPFANADYIFHQSKVVAELKCLKEDKSDDPAMKRRLGDLWLKWQREGLVQGATPPTIDSRTLPHACQNEMCRTMGEPIKRCIQKANLQIRATKSALNLPNYHGVLLLANDGNLIFEMPVMIHLISLTIKDHFHEIDSVAFFCGNMFSWVSGVERPVKFWITLHRDETIVPLADLTNRLSKEWERHYSSITGVGTEPTEIGDMEFFMRQMQSHLV